jgi:hypothetical protein
MCKGVCAAVAAIVLLGISSAKAGDTQDFQKDFQVGPLKISVQGKSGVEIGTSPTPATPTDDYWLGVVCAPVPEPLRSQLGLAGQDGGILIRDVAPESPAAKAGIRHDDVLWKAAGKVLASPQDLLKTVNDGKNKKLALELIRAGKKMTLNVQPEKRPEHLGKSEGGWGDAADMQALQGWLNHMLPGEGSPMQIHVFGPSVILPQGAPLYPNLPDNVTVTITKHGQDPAKITVQDGGKTTSVTEKELDKLPKDVRPYVDQMLGPTGWRGMVTGKAGVGFGGSSTIGNVTGLGPGMVHSDTRLQKRLDEMSRQIDEMQQSVEQLKQKNAPPAKPQSEKSKDQPVVRPGRT